MTSTSPQPGSESASLSRERRFVLLTALAAVLITLIPYLVGAALANGRQFMWLGYNLDDSCVYLSWMQQASAGSLRAFDLFTTDPQHGILPNPLFFALGLFHRFTGLPLLALYHLARLGLGFVLLLIVYKLIRMTVADLTARRLAFLFVCFSSGLGWLPFWWPNAPIQTPIDKWQPEAITFLSLYLSPLFCGSMALQVGILALLLQGERTGRLRYAFAAGVCGFALGVVHSYDVITMAAIWFAYLIAFTLTTLFRSHHKPENGDASAHKSLSGSWLRGLLAGILTAPSVYLIFEQYRQDPLFHARANVPTLAPGLQWVLAGYGLTLLLALIGIFALQSSAGQSAPAPTLQTAEPEAEPTPLPPTREKWTTGTDAGLLLIVWMAINIAVSYLPAHPIPLPGTHFTLPGFPFQRKMLQGTHFPIAILAGIGAASLLALSRRMLSPVYRALALGVLTFILGLTNLLFMMRDYNNFENNRAQTGLERPYLQPGEIQALDWIQAHTPENAAIQPIPWLFVDPERHKIGTSDVTLACFTPGLIRRAVYCGHWGETPDFGDRLGELRQLILANTPDTQRIALLRKMNVRYLIFSQKATADPAQRTSQDAILDNLIPMFRGTVPPPSYLIHVYGNDDADVYAVQLPSAS
ncbi:MAG TPA: hypothetical protein VFA07_17875 [Chthonomonadaceae bacterium]|nr:hypothetical protein [Chthonomonadaceae bacterium]